MKQRLFKVMVREVHEYVAWVSAPDEATALAKLRAGNDPDIERQTVHRDLFGEFCRGQDTTDSNGLPSKRGRRKGRCPLQPAEPPHVEAHEAAPAPDEGSAVSNADLSRHSVSCDAWLDDGLKQLDAAIDAMPSLQDTSREAWLSVLRGAQDGARSLLQVLDALDLKVSLGMPFTRNGCVIAPAGVAEHARRVNERLYKLERAEAERD